MVKTGNPQLDKARVQEILETTKVPLVLHGGSGSSDEDIVKVIDGGISMIHVSTELRVAYKRGLQEGVNNLETLAPYRYAQQAKKELAQVVKEKIMLFWRLS